MYKDDTIYASATGLGRSAIGIIRVSGPDAVSICDKIFKGKKRISDMNTYTATYGKIVDNTDIIDEAIVLLMKAPHSYTTEDVVEINVHGGPYVVKRVMSLLEAKGIRLADPGEFTKRAYLGGRIDMTEAEAVMDVISSETDKALRASVSQLSGKLREEIVSIRERLLYYTAYIESALDDPENYDLEGYSDELKRDVEKLTDRIDRLLSTADEGRIVREGISTAIIGRPNVGKSSILNLLLGEERAIVTDIEGTTRDTLEEYANLGGALLKLVDTAGIRETDDAVERIGVERAKDSIDSADLILLILDGSENLRDEDRSILRSLEDKKYIILVNKSDKLQVLDREELENLSMGQAVIEISANTGDGLTDLREKLQEMFFTSSLDYNDQIIITRSRHRNALVRAKDSLNKVLESIANRVSEDLYTIDMLDAYETLGEIIGETLEDDLADKIFSEFCMGK